MDNEIFINTGLQPSANAEDKEDRSNGFPAADQPLERLAAFTSLPTRLKPDVNQTCNPSPAFWEID